MASMELEEDALLVKKATHKTLFEQYLEDNEIIYPTFTSLYF